MSAEAAEPYPEHKKQAAVLGDAGVIGEFLDWLEADGILLGRNVTVDPGRYQFEDFQAIGEGFQSLLERYFDIDPGKIEAEKRAMIEVMRKANERQQS